MSTYIFAVVLNNPLRDSEFLLVKQARPPKFSEEEYNCYVDSDLWDLPSTRLNRVEGERGSGFFIEWKESCSENVDLTGFDVEAAIGRVIMYFEQFFSSSFLSGEVCVSDGVYSFYTFFLVFLRRFWRYSGFLGVIRENGES